MHDADKVFYGNGLPYLKVGPLKGSLIVIEGTDGVGRSTQIEALTRWLEVQGYGVVNTGWTRSPLLAETINEAKEGHELNVTTFSLLYAADFADRLENQIIPALRAGFIVIADRYMYTAFARNAVMGADPEWTRKLFGFAVVPDLVLYLQIDVRHLIPRVLESKGMDYWESGMHLKLGGDIFDSFRRYQARIIREYNQMVEEVGFVTVDARQPIDVIQEELRNHIGRYLAGTVPHGVRAVPPTRRRLVGGSERERSTHARGLRTRQAALMRGPLAALVAATLFAAPGCRIDAAAPPGSPAQGAAQGRRVIVIVVDGLDARQVGDVETPVLARLWRESPWCPGTQGRAAMPARTNVNHASLLTGVFPAVHGVTGNAFWDRESESPRKLGAAGDLLTETLFTVAARSRPELRTAAALGKGKLAVMFAASPGGQVAPGQIWGPSDATDAGRDSRTGYAYDRATLDGLRALLAHETVDFALVNLADVDRVSHGAGPLSVAATQARNATDAALGELIAFLRQQPNWKDTTVVITADHGFDTVRRPPIVFDTTARAAGLTGLVSVGDGGVDHVYLREQERTPAGATLLASARRLALVTPGIVEALYLRGNDTDGGDAHTLDGVHPDWQLGHERVGDLVLVAEPGAVLVDGDAGETLLPGNHGGPGDRAVPVIVVRDGPRVPDPCRVPEAADVGRTLFSCLGLRDVERLDGGPIPSPRRGRVLAGLCG